MGAALTGVTLVVVVLGGALALLGVSAARAGWIRRTVVVARTAKRTDERMESPCPRK